MSIPAIKAVGIGLGPAVAARPGSRVHDEIVPDPSGTAYHRRQPAFEQRRRPRRRRHQRRGRSSVGVDEADLDADEAATIRRSDDDDGVARGHRAERRLRSAGGSCRRRGDGRARTGRCAGRPLRRRHDRGSRSRARGFVGSRARSVPARNDPTDPAVRRPSAARCRLRCRHLRRQPSAAHRRHDRDDVRRARRRARGNAGRRPAARCSWSMCPSVAIRRD